jgi:hypothetical protein
MALIDLERAVLSICFRAEPPETSLAELGDRRSWLIYREMVRERLLREIRVALPRSCRLLGEARLLQAFALHLDRDPPRTRFFREIVGAFVKSAWPLWQADASLPAECMDMLRYELALWEVRDLPAHDAAGDAEFSFDRVALICPALRLLTVAHAVHLTAADDERLPQAEYLLCIHRAPGADRVRTWTLTRVTYDLLQRWQRAESSVAETVQQLGVERGVAIDASFVDALCTTLAQFIEVGIVLGSR